MSRIKNNPLNWIDKEPEEEKQKPIRPQQNVRREYTKSSQEGLKENWTRATFIVREDILEKFKDYAYTERLTHKELINSILEDYLKDKEIIERGEN